MNTSSAQPSVTFRLEVGAGMPGMSAIALVLSQMGHDVSGSDLRELPVLDRLRAGGWAQWFRGRVFLSHHQGMLDEGGQGAA